MIDLPTTPYPLTQRVRLMSNAVELTPPMGGSAQRIGRLGDRFAVELTLPPMDWDCARSWVAARVRATADTARWTLAQPGTAPGGTILVNGAGQAGTSLAVDGATAGAQFKAGQYVSFEKNGRTYLHMVVADVTANGSGAATLTIAPKLRSAPADNTALEFAAPKIEGFIQGSPEWEVDFVATYGLTLTLQEVE